MAAHQAPLSLGFFRQEHWSRLPLPSPKLELAESKSLACALKVEPDTGSQGPPGSDSLGGLQRGLVWDLQSEAGTWGLALALRICGIQDSNSLEPRSLCLYNGNKVHLLPRIIERIEEELRATIPYLNSLGPDVFLDPEYSFWNLKREDGGNITYFLSLQHDLGQGPVIKCINISSGKLMNIHSPWVNKD